MRPIRTLPGTSLFSLFDLQSTRPDVEMSEVQNLPIALHELHALHALQPQHRPIRGGGLRDQVTPRCFQSEATTIFGRSSELRAVTGERCSPRMPGKLSTIFRHEREVDDDTNNRVIADR